MFEACLSLPRDPREARLIADSLEALGRALREWPEDAWRKIETDAHADGLFERLAARTAPVAVDPLRRGQATASAEAVAAVLRALWPAPQAAEVEKEMLLAAG